jgi:hypothetical protein
VIVTAPSVPSSIYNMYKERKEQQEEEERLLQEEEEERNRRDAEKKERKGCNFSFFDKIVVMLDRTFNYHQHMLAVKLV